LATRPPRWSLAAAPSTADAPAGELTEPQLEALLFVAERPLTRREIGILAGVDRATVDERLGDLEVSLASRGIRLLLSGDRVELATAPEAGALVARYVGADAVRLSPAAIETLAIVAYRQPCTRLEIEAIRGVDADAVLTTLTERRLVRVLGRKEAPGRPLLYGTTREFLEVFGLPDLNALPTLRELGAPEDIFKALAPEGDVVPEAAEGADAAGEPSEEPASEDGD